MYVNPAFKTEDADAWDFVASRGFGAVVAVDAETPAAAHVPLYVTPRDSKPAIEFHLARANPLHTVIAKAPRVLVIVSGPDAYISPDWYVAEDQVPTWNYIAAHITGTASPMAAEEAHAHVEAMSLAFEERLRPKKPWSTSKMTERRRAMMLAAIVPIRVEVERIACAHKLSQNKIAADRMETARMLEWRGGADERGIAEAMRRSMRAAKSSG
jgi:transcriptional regulator